MHVWPVDLNESIVKKSECNSQDCAGFTDVVCNCGFDFAKKSLSHIFKNVPESSIAALQPKDSDWFNKGKLTTFDQHEFIEDKKWLEYTGLQKNGYLYYPNICIEKKCKLVVLLHGCQMSTEVNGVELVMNNGFPEYSVNNDLILLMPQVKQSPFKNFNGCWDYSPSQKIGGNTLFNTN